MNQYDEVESKKIRINYNFIIAGGMCGLFTIILGAFGAHVLKNTIQNMPAYQTAVQYQSFHSLALILLGVIMFQLNNKYLKWAGIFYIIGIILFCGSLYLLSMTKILTFALITPVGGVAFLLGWVSFLLGLRK